MSSEKIDCTFLQEKISWNKNLSQAELEHSIECKFCGEILLQMEELDALIKQDEEVKLPVDFANKVMKEIDKKESFSVENILCKIDYMINHIIHTGLARLLIGGISFFLTIRVH